MRRSPSALLVVAVVARLAIAEPTKDAPTKDASTKDASTKDATTKDASTKDASTKDAPQTGFLGLGKGQHSKEPVTITADTLEYEYKDGIVVYRGDVLAVQGELKIRSNELRITLAKSEGNGKNGGNPASELDEAGSGRVQEVIATGSVRIDQGTRWAVGGKATFDQSNRTVILTENPVLHDGRNEVAGDRVIVYIDEDRSVVEGGRKRVKAVLFPGSETAKKDGTKDESKDAAAKDASKKDGVTKDGVKKGDAASLDAAPKPEGGR